VAFAPDGTLTWGTEQGEIKLAAPEGSEPPRVLAGHEALVRTLAFTRDGRTLASGGDDRLVRIWRAASWQEVLTLPGHKDAVYSLAFTPDGRSLATACHDGTVRLWPTDCDD
jgi:WD40 repeat protein